MTTTTPPPQAGADRSGRRVLEGVCRVCFGMQPIAPGQPRLRCPEDFPFPACLRAALSFMGQDPGCHQTGHADFHWRSGCGYALLMGVTGAAFQMNWKNDWADDFCALHYICEDDSEPYRRGFEALGYEPQIFCGLQFRNDEPGIRKRIIESIDAGRPVLASGVVGPPVTSLIVGYDEAGDVLIGWSFFQQDPAFAQGLDFEPAGYFRKRNWFPDTWDAMFFGRRRQPLPDPPEVYRQALNWAMKIIRTPRTHGTVHNGLGAYQAWADALEDDRLFNVEDPAFRKRREIHQQATGILAEARWYASVFLTEAAWHLPYQASALLAAASSCARQHELVWEMWAVFRNMPPAEAENAFAGPEARRKLAQLIRCALGQERIVAEQIERALGMPRG